MSVVDHLRQEIVKVESELEAALLLLVQCSDKLNDVSTRMDGGVAELLSDIDLTGLSEIRYVLEGIPSEYRNEPGNSPYFDKLERILSSLAD
tara:strand:- start:91 stop:366 length:276 start_codon:yes stop_codon:yes gene_type:complete